MPFNAHRNALEPGHTLHWYTIHDVLGQGGFGITYLAHDPNLDQAVAIKEYLPAELSVRDTDNSVHPISEKHRDDFRWGLERFVAEARMLSRFDHPNVVRVLAVFEMNETAYMVMDYESGRTLKAMLSPQATMDELWLKRMVLPVIDGLSQVHGAGFIHRDIKPGNLFIREDDTPVLIDFGSARQALGQETRTLTTLVSRGYAPFEQYYGKSDRQGPWTDIYGLGATLYRAATGEVPVDAMERSESLLSKGEDPYVPASEFAGERCTRSFLAAIDHALAFREQDRPQDLSIWARELRGNQPRTAATRSVDRPTARIEPPTPRARAKPQAPALRRRPGSGRRRHLAMGGAAGLLVIAFVAAMQPTQPEPVPETLPPEEGTPIVKTESKTGIDALLAEARNDLGSMRLAGPDGNNASARYREVLATDPENREALSGLRTIFDYYSEMGSQAARAGHLGKAREYINQALDGAPDDDTRTTARMQLRALERQLRASYPGKPLSRRRPTWRARAVH